MSKLGWGKKGQAGVEYLIIVGFVTFAIMSIIVLAFFYSDQIKDRIRLNQVENFASQLTSSAESVFHSGEPSKTTVRLYLPEGVQSVEITQDSVFITTTVSGGVNKRAFSSSVPLEDGTINSGEGIKKLTLTAQENFVGIVEG